VILVPFARRGQHLDLVYAQAERALPHPEDLMHKALGWLLREAGKTDSGRLEAFLLQHRSAIPRTSVRYALERFPLEAKARLMKATRV
jgi:3-methyladenine DNA glycosylase AlkD